MKARRMMQMGIRAARQMAGARGLEQLHPGEGVEEEVAPQEEVDGDRIEVILWQILSRCEKCIDTREDAGVRVR
jgi:hypothetical protein